MKFPADGKDMADNTDSQYVVKERKPQIKQMTQIPQFSQFTLLTTQSDI